MMLDDFRMIGTELLDIIQGYDGLGIRRSILLSYGSLLPSRPRFIHKVKPLTENNHPKTRQSSTLFLRPNADKSVLQSGRFPEGTTESVVFKA